MSNPAHAAAGGADGAELFIYYRIHESAAAEAAAILQACQQRLCAEHAGLEARVLRRPQAVEHLQTWMETYRLAHSGIGTALQSDIEAAMQPLLRLIHGQRQVEVFIPCA